MSVSCNFWDEKEVWACGCSRPLIARMIEICSGSKQGHTVELNLTSLWKWHYSGSFGKSTNGDSTGFDYNFSTLLQHFIQIVPQLNYSHKHFFVHLRRVRSNLGFGVLPEDTLACGVEQPGIAPPTLQVMDALLYFLILSRFSFQWSIYITTIKLTFSHHTLLYFYLFIYYFFDLFVKICLIVRWCVLFIFQICYFQEQTVFVLKIKHVSQQKWCFSVGHFKEGLL